MYTHKKAMITSLVLMLVCGIFALALEFSCEEVYIKHKDFIVNLMLGIFASSLVTLVVSYLSYKEIWSESLADYILIADELFYKNAFFHRYLIGIMKKGNISLEECVSDELLDKIQKIQLELRRLDTTIRKISIIKIPFFKGKRRKIFDEIMEHYSIASEYSSVLSQVEKYILYVRANEEGGWLKIVNEFYLQFQRMINYLDEGDNTLYSAHGDLRQEYFSYYKIEE